MPEPASARSRRLFYGSLFLVAVALAVLLLARGCSRRDQAPFDWLRDKAEQLGHSIDRVAHFVADEVQTLPYQGNVKGALGTLWEGAGSPQEKQALADALRACCADQDPAPAAPAGLAATIVHRGATDTVVYDGPIGDLVGDVHSIETVTPGRTRITIRGRPAITRDLDAGATGEELVFRIQRPDAPPLEITRELWHQDNRLGPIRALAGDRHDFVVLPCRVGPRVREKEELRLTQHGRAGTADARAYLTLLDYCLRSDRQLANLEHDLHVRARFDLPRILLLSRAKTADLPDGAVALDLRLDRVAFDGAPSDAHLATQVRSFVESGLEHHFLQELTQQPCTSTWDVFHKLDDDRPDSYDRRMGMLRQAIEALGERGRGTFRARKDGPLVTVDKDGDRCTVTGGRIDERIVGHLAQLPEAPPLGSTCADAETAALMVELALMGTGVAPDYLLDVVELARADASLVVPGARFTFHWGDGADTTDEAITVDACAPGLQLAWRVQTGLRPVRGRRTLTAHALAEATTHNPWYVQGEDQQDEATSFCVSRRVFEQVLAGKPFAMALQDRRRPEDDPQAGRRVAWQGEATSLGAGTRTVLVNGREETLAFRRLRLGARELAILDDARFPVGMADAITAIRTAVRVRLVDEAGLGISGAELAIAGHETVRSGPDGRCLLPPLDGKVQVVVSRDRKPLGEREVDCTAPGRSELVVTVPRPRKELLFVTKDTAGQLAALGLSPQARRHLDRQLALGYQIVIPDHAVEVDGIDVFAWYAHDVSTGETVAVTEDGLHGSSVSYGRALASLARDLAKAGNKPQPFVHVHALRGALIAWWMYGKERVGGAEHDEALQKMLDEMDAWEKATNLLTGLDTVPGARKAMGKLMGKAGWDMDNAGASAAFKIGFIGATRFLEHKLEGS